MTRAEVELGVLLTQRITLLTAPQATAFGYAAAIDRLRRRGLLTHRTLVFRPLEPGAEPLAVHRPGDPFPAALAREVANRAAARSAGTPVAEVVVYQATRKAFAGWGDAARKRGNPFSYGHDHLLTLAFLRLRQDERARWRYEPTVRSGGPEQRSADADRFIKVPDAALVDDQGRPLVFHEAVGSYPAERIQALAAHTDQALAHRAGKPTAGIVFW